MVSAVVEGRILLSIIPTLGKLSSLQVPDCPCSRWNEWCRGADVLLALLLEAEGHILRWTISSMMHHAITPRADPTLGVLRITGEHL